jgi:hypothetical protein
MTGQTKAKRKSTTFEHKAGTLPSLQRAAPRPAANPPEAAAPDETAAAPVPGFLSHKEVILRLVETLKAL